MRAQEVRGLMEAYSQVHRPDVVDIAAEIWVSTCIAEGVDFSQYTLDELTEGFIVDMSSEDLSESLLSEILGMDGAQNFGASLRQGFGKARRAVGGAIGNVAKGAVDIAGAGAQGLAGQKTTSSNPLARLANTVSRTQTAIPRAVASVAAGVLTGKGGTPAAKPKVNPNSSIDKYNTKDPDGTIRSRLKVGPGIVGPKKVGPKKVGPGSAGSGGSGSGGSGSGGSGSGGSGSAAPKPATTAPKPTGSAMDQWAKANPKLAAAKAEKDRIRGTSQTDNPLMKDMKDRMPMTPSVQSPTLAKDLGKGSGNQSLVNNPNASKAAPPKASPTPTAAPKPTEPKKRETQLFHTDLFDLVKGHLLDEGYADSEEGAMVMMTNMSEQWRRSILEAHGVEILDEISKELATKAFANRATRAFEMDDTEESEKADKTKERIVKKYGKKSGDEAEKAAERGIYGHNKYSEAQEREQAKKKATKVTKEDLQAWVGQLIAEGYDLSEYTWEEVAEVYFEELELAEAQSARENPEKYERSSEAKEGRRKRSGMNDPKTGINSPAFQAFMAQQMGGKKKKD